MIKPLLQTIYIALRDKHCMFPTHTIRIHINICVMNNKLNSSNTKTTVCENGGITIHRISKLLLNMFSTQRIARMFCKSRPHALQGRIPHRSKSYAFGRRICTQKPQSKAIWKHETTCSLCINSEQFFFFYV